MSFFTSYLLLSIYFLLPTSYFLLKNYFLLNKSDRIMSQEIEQKKDWVLSVPEQNVKAFPEADKSVIIHIPLESWSFNSFDRASSVSIVIGGNLVGNGNIPPLPPPNHHNLSFQSRSAPPIQRIDSTRTSIRLNSSGQNLESNIPAKKLSQEQSNLLPQLSSYLENALAEENRRIKEDTNSLTKIGSAEEFSSSSVLSRRYQEKEFVDFIPQSDRSHLDKLLLAIALLYSLIMFVALAGKFNLNFVQLLMSPVAKTPVERTISNSDTQFISYMKRSLEAIDRKAQTQETTVASDNLENKAENLIANKPSIVSNNSLPPVNPVAFPTSWQTASPVGNALPAVPSVPDPSSFAPPPPPPVLKTTATPKKILNLPPPSLSETKTPPTPVAKPALAGYTLIGLLDLGEKSAALFESNDTTQQIWVGEEIGETGWTVKAVTPRSVKIARKGKNRSLSVGDKF
jgi:hypothetical protein